MGLKGTGREDLNGATTLTIVQKESNLIDNCPTILSILRESLQLAWTCPDTGVLGRIATDHGGLGSVQDS